ncbi:hypothetical protein VI06_21065 [Aquitalea magnusonii]|nr:hypothetical protein VI06_21065 [Aquitalea magnusonii]
MLGVLAMGISAGFAYLYVISWIESRQVRKLANKLPYPSGLASESRMRLSEVANKPDICKLFIE